MNRYAKLIKTLSVCVAAAGLLWATGAMAGNVASTRIVNIMASGGPNNLLLVYTNTAPTGVAACGTQTATAGVYRWAMDPSTAAGRTGIAAMMLAYSMGKSIYIVGTGTCTLVTDTETISYFVTL